jgi:secondary thiamine-phosphate synthase enzyme
MKARTQTITTATKRHIELIDLTQPVEEAVRSFNIRIGICIVHVPHATAAVIANENEQGLIHDYISKIETFYPSDGSYHHNRIDDNAASHLAAGLIGNARAFPIHDGKLVRGTWQNIFLVELDGPRSRRSIVVTALGE